MRSWIYLATLLVIVGALGAWVYYKPKTSEHTSHALSTLIASDVKRARFERVSTPRTAQSADTQQPTTTTSVISLERIEGQWRMTAPIAARTDKFQIDRLFSILEARSTVRYPATDLARFGLEQPLATLTVEDQTFAFGAINKTTREQYVMTHNEVYLVAPAYGAALPRNADALLARQLLAANEMPVRFDLPGFTLALEDGTWAVAPAAPDLSADDRSAWVESWRQASAMSVAAHSGGTAAQDIRIELKDGRILHLGIVKREPELVLVRADEGVQYLFVPDIAKRLMSPPGANRSTDAVNK